MSRHFQIIARLSAHHLGSDHYNNVISDNVDHHPTLRVNVKYVNGRRPFTPTRNVNRVAELADQVVQSATQVTTHVPNIIYKNAKQHKK